MDEIRKIVQHHFKLDISEKSRRFDLVFALIQIVVIGCFAVVLGCSFWLIEKIIRFFRNRCSKMI